MKNKIVSLEFNAVCNYFSAYSAVQMALPLIMHYSLNKADIFKKQNHICEKEINAIKRKYKHCISIHEVSYVSHMFNMRNFKKLILHIECFLSYKISTTRVEYRFS